MLKVLVGETFAKKKSSARIHTAGIDEGYSFVDPEQGDDLRSRAAGRTRVSPAPFDYGSQAMDSAPVMQGCGSCGYR